MSRLSPAGRVPTKVLVLLLTTIAVLLASAVIAAPSGTAQPDQLPSDEEALEAARDEFYASIAADVGQNLTDGELQVINGRNVAEGEFPFLVGIELRPIATGRTICGGTLITPTKVITAAHCVNDGFDVFVRLGSRDRNTPEQVVPASNVYVHPEYISRREDGALVEIRNDIAVIELAQPANVESPNIATIPWGPELATDDEIRVIGWGNTQTGRPIIAPRYPDLAQTVTIPLVACDSPSAIGENDFRNMCARDTRGASACDGDSGGPIVQWDDEEYRLVAIVSFGATSCTYGHYNTYERVSTHKLWIEDPTVPPVACLDEWVTIDMNKNGGKGQGTSGNDVILGTSGDDYIRAGSGHDVVCAGPGDDRVLGQQGADRISGGLGDDVLHGNLGRDVLYGNAGNDRVFGYADRDILFGGVGNDRLHGNFGNDDVHGGDGNDWVLGYGDNDLLLGGNGNDLVVGNRDTDRLHGGNGADRLIGSDGNDRLEGDAGNDRLEGNSGNDVLRGDEGSDDLDGGIGRDVCVGGSGFDSSSRCEDQISVP